MKLMRIIGEDDKFIHLALPLKLKTEDGRIVVPDFENIDKSKDINAITAEPRWKREACIVSNPTNAPSFRSPSFVASPSINVNRVNEEQHLYAVNYNHQHIKQKVIPKRNIFLPVDIFREKLLQLTQQKRVQHDQQLLQDHKEMHSSSDEIKNATKYFFSSSPIHAHVYSGLSNTLTVSPKSGTTIPFHKNPKDIPLSLSKPNNNNNTTYSSIPSSNIHQLQTMVNVSSIPTGTLDNLQISTANIQNRSDIGNHIHTDIGNQNAISIYQQGNSKSIFPTEDSNINHSRYGTISSTEVANNLSGTFHFNAMDSVTQNINHSNSNQMQQNFNNYVNISGQSATIVKPPLGPPRPSSVIPNLQLNVSSQSPIVDISRPNQFETKEIFSGYNGELQHPDNTQSNFKEIRRNMRSPSILLNLTAESSLNENSTPTNLTIKNEYNENIEAKGIKMENTKMSLTSSELREHLKLTEVDKFYNNSAINSVRSVHILQEAAKEPSEINRFEQDINKKLILQTVSNTLPNEGVRQTSLLNQSNEDYGINELNLSKNARNAQQNVLRFTTSHDLDGYGDFEIVGGNK